MRHFATLSSRHGISCPTERLPRLSSVGHASGDIFNEWGVQWGAFRTQVQFNQLNATLAASSCESSGHESWA